MTTKSKIVIYLINKLDQQQLKNPKSKTFQSFVKPKSHISSGT